MIRRRRLLPLAVLLFAGFLFRVGNAAAALALPWLALTHTGSAVWAGATAAAGVLATVAGASFGGHLIDRLGPAPVAWVGGVVGGVAVAAIPMLAGMGLLGPASLVALVALGAAFDAPAVAAQDSRLPELGRLAGLRLEKVATAKGFMGQSALLCGPLLAGLCIGLLGAARTLQVTAAASIAAGLFAWRVLRRRRGRRRAHRNQPSGGDTSAWAGLVHLIRAPLLGRLLLVVTLGAATLGASNAVVLPALFHGADRPATDLGLFMSAQGIGGLAGLAVQGVLPSKLPERFRLAMAYAQCAVVLCVLSLLPPAPVLVAIGLWIGLMTAPLSPILNTVIYRLTPQALRGRVLGAISAVVTSASPLVIVMMGLGVERWGARAMLVVAGLLVSVSAALSLRLRFEPMLRARLEGAE